MIKFEKVQFQKMMKFLCLFICIASITIACDDDDDDDDITNTPPTIASITADPASVTSGGTTTLTVVAEDADGDSLSYTWYKEAGETDEEIPSATTNEYTTEALTEEATYYVIVSDGTDTVTSDAVTITIDNSAPTITSFSASPGTTINSADTATLTVTAEDADGDALSYAWYIRGDTDELIDGATTKEYTTEALTENTSYYVVVSDGTDSETTTVITIEINDAIK